MKKLKLDDLVVRSFVTALTVSNSDTIKGGTGKETCQPASAICSVGKYCDTVSPDHCPMETESINDVACSVATCPSVLNTCEGTDKSAGTFSGKG